MANVQKHNSCKKNVLLNYKIIDWLPANLWIYSNDLLSLQSNEY
jgi:hypothetical protein